VLHVKTHLQFPEPKPQLDRTVRTAPARMAVATVSKHDVAAARVATENAHDYVAASQHDTFFVVSRLPGE
jgi:hypothetical protein